LEQLTCFGLQKELIFGVTNNVEVKKMHDVNKTEILMLGILTVLVIVFGFYPAPLIETFDISVNNLINNYEMAISSEGIK